MSEHGQRSPFKDMHYFNAAVAYNDQSIREFESVLSSPSTSTRHRTRLRHSLFKRSFEQLITRFSRGDDFSLLKDSISATIDALEAYRLIESGAAYDFRYLDQYVISLWLISLSILLEVPNDRFVHLLGLIENEGRDIIFERLVGLCISGRPKPIALLHPKPYGILESALNSTGDERSRLLRSFLDDYYNRMKDSYWYGTHLRNDSSFFGYWCFEVAAFVKCLNIDDRDFAQSNYYPRWV